MTYLSYQEKIMLEKDPVVKCKECQKEFTKVRGRQVFCKTSCRRLNWEKVKGRKKFVKQQLDKGMKTFKLYMENANLIYDELK